MRRVGYVLTFGAMALVAGCGGVDEEAPVVSEPEYEGISRDQLELDAESMTPEEAERLGIVDTTILIQPPMNPDSVVPPIEPQVVPLDTTPDS